MARVVHKFLVPHYSKVDQAPAMPAHPSAPVRHVGAEPATGYPAVWIEVVPDATDDAGGRRMAAFGTGDEIPREYDICGQYVWHVYEAQR